MGMLSADTFEKLKRFDSPTISNVIELFDVIPRNQGYMDHRIQSRFPELPPMVGFAATASFRADAPPRGGDSYGSLEDHIAGFSDLPGPAVVVFQDLDDPPVAAVFGEVMCSSYKAFDAAGLITNGAGRDLLQVRGLEFPVFTGSTIVSHGYCQIMHIGLPVRVGGLVVHQADLLHGDANGVTSIPLEIADQVADVGTDFVEAENVIMDYVKADGKKCLTEFRQRVAEFKDVVGKLKQRVAR